VLNTLRESRLPSLSSPPMGKTREREQAVENAFFNRLLGLRVALCALIAEMASVFGARDRKRTALNDSPTLV